jgi:putative ABC transport system substrate-binding protein
MLKEIAPGIVRAGFVANPKTATYEYYLRAGEALGPSLGIDVVLSPFENAGDIERAIGSFSNAPNGGLVVVPDFTSVVHRDLIIALAAQHKLPSVYYTRLFVASGGLMSYGVDFVDLFRQGAAYVVDRILRGDNPADLPVQAATKFETTVNLKTAKALGLTVPPGLLVAAEEVIEWYGLLQCMSRVLALRSYAENDAQRPLLAVKADTLLRRGDRRF